LQQNNQTWIEELFAVHRNQSTKWYLEDGGANWAGTEQYKETLQFGILNLKQPIRSITFYIEELRASGEQSTAGGNVWSYADSKSVGGLGGAFLCRHSLQEYEQKCTRRITLPDPVHRWFVTHSIHFGERENVQRL
jgi:hypothetical protein